MTQRTSTEVAADLVIYRAARTKLVSGERIEDVSRDGRRIKFGAMTLSQVEQAILSLEREYESALAVEAGGRRRSAIGTYF